MNIKHPLMVVETCKEFYILNRYSKYSVHDCVSFSPAKLCDSYAKLLFILYQLLHATSHCHKYGSSVGQLKLKDIEIDENLWVKVELKPDISLLKNCLNIKDSESSACSSNTATSLNDSNAQRKLSSQTSYNDVLLKEDLPAIVHKWVHGQISNLDYLMVLNHLAGRSVSEPNHHPFVPWVMDFSQENGGFRDLTKSKFRLNKGDHQLDLTYDIPVSVSTDNQMNSHMNIPHHVSDVLSDITYYLYNARRTSKSVLCAHVRSKWVPHEYPASIQRIQQVTPDECIPQFFTDPSIFTSIHDDLPDLEVPQWCESPEDFIKKHREVLEGEYVSSNLHHWIDLSFGYKVLNFMVGHT